jgi:hypothetical protein
MISDTVSNTQCVHWGLASFGSITSILDDVHQSVGLNVQYFVSGKRTVKAVVSCDPLVGYFDIVIPFFSQLFDCDDEVEVALSTVKHASSQAPAARQDRPVVVTDKLNGSDWQVLV